MGEEEAVCHEWMDGYGLGLGYARLGYAGLDVYLSIDVYGRTCIGTYMYL